jgi:hypothetical protein
MDNLAKLIEEMNQLKVAEFKASYSHYFEILKKKLVELYSALSSIPSNTLEKLDGITSDGENYTIKLDSEIYRFSQNYIEKDSDTKTSIHFDENSFFVTNNGKKTVNTDMELNEIVKFTDDWTKIISSLNKVFQDSLEKRGKYLEQKITTF